MKCYRIENNNGIGFCLGSYSEDLPKSLIIRHRSLNTPREDNLDLYKEDKEWFCAFRSMEDLDKWITMDELEYFIERGFNLYILEVSEYQIGDHQLVFTKESITNKKNITNELLTI